MLKLPKGLKKKKKGKKSKRKGEDELFTEEELEQYKREHQQQQQQGEGSKENEEWSKFKHLTTGVDSVLKKSQGDLNRIKESSFFQRIPAGARQVDRTGETTVATPTTAPATTCVQVTAADFPHLQQQQREDHSECPSEESDEDDQEDIFDTSYVEAVERGDVKLALVPDSPEDAPDDDLFDTSHVDKLIKGQEARTPRGKKVLDIGVAVEVLTGRIDNVQLPTVKRPAKRVIPGDLLLEEDTPAPAAPAPALSPPECSILDANDDLPPAAPLDLSVSLHPPTPAAPLATPAVSAEQEEDEFSQLAAESLEASVVATVVSDIHAEPVPQEAWSAFEADKNASVFAEGIAEDQLDVDPYAGQDDPFDTSFAECAVPPPRPPPPAQDPRPSGARLNNRRKSSVRIHVIDPSGERESITSDDAEATRDLLAGSCSDLTQLAVTPLAPAAAAVAATAAAADDSDFDPFDTSRLEAATAPGPRELRLLEQELITTATKPVYRVPSDPDFDPRADESVPAPAPALVSTRRASRPENLSCKSVGFSVPPNATPRCAPLPATPYYCRDRSVGEEVAVLNRTHSEEELVSCSTAATTAARRHSALPPLHAPLTPRAPHRPAPTADPFDTSFASTGPGRAELRLLAKEFSCEEDSSAAVQEPNLLEPENELFQVRALSPALPDAAEDLDPFDTSFATDLRPGRTELKVLESEFLQ